MPQPLMLKKLKSEPRYEDLQDLLELTPQKDVLFIIGYWKAKVGSQEIPGVTGKFGLEYKMKQGKTLLAFALLHSVLQDQIGLLLQVFLDFLLLYSSRL